MTRERIGATAHELAAAYIEGLDGIPYPVVAEDVLIALLHGGHMLLTHRFQRRLRLYRRAASSKRNSSEAVAIAAFNVFTEFITPPLQVQYHLVHQPS